MPKHQSCSFACCTKIHVFFSFCLYNPFHYLMLWCAGLIVDTAGGWGRVGNVPIIWVVACEFCHYLGNALIPPT